MSGLTFNAERHEYRLNGVIVPSVTQITDQFVDFSFVNPEALELARQRGTAVHIACELDDYNELDESTVDPRIVPYLDAYRKFRYEGGFTPEHTEMRVYSERYGFAGTLDRRGPMNGGKATLLDIKTGATASPSWALQTAGYALAYDEMYGATTKGRCVLQLKPNGKYNLIHYKGRNDTKVFLAALAVFNWKKGHAKRQI